MSAVNSSVLYFQCSKGLKEMEQRISATWQVGSGEKYLLIILLNEFY